MAKKKQETASLIETFAEFKQNKNIDLTTMVGVLEESFRSIIAKIFGSDENFDVIVNPEKGDCEIYRNRVVVNDDEVEDPNKQISLSEAQQIDATYEVGEDVSEESTSQTLVAAPFLHLVKLWLAKSSSSNTTPYIINTKTAWANSSLPRFTRHGRAKPYSWTKRRTNSTCPSHNRYPATSSTKVTP